MYSEILKPLKTTSQKNDLLISLRELILELDQPKQSSQELINKFLPVKFSSLIDIDQVNTDPKNFFKNLESAIENIPVASLEVGIEPTQNLVDVVVQWFDDNVGEQVILDFSTNPEVIVGAKIGFKGKFFDGTGT